MDLRVDVDLRQFDALTARGRLIGKLTAESLNRIAEKGRTIAVNQITSELNLGRNYVFSRFKLVKATQARQEAQIRGARRAAQLRRFASKQEAAGVSAVVTPGGPRKVVRSSFFARLRQGGYGVFRRAGPPGGQVGRYPIEVLYGPQPSQVFLRIAPDVSLDLTVLLQLDIQARAARFFNSGVTA